MERTFEEYIRSRNDKIDRTPELEAWVEWQAKNTPSLRGEVFASATPPTPRRCERGSGNRDEGDDTQMWEFIQKAGSDIPDTIWSQGESELKPGYSERFSPDSSTSTKRHIDPRWRPYHGDPLTCDPVVSREEFDRYRVLAEEQMKRLRQERDQLLKMYSKKCNDLQQKVTEDDEKQEIPGELAQTSISAKAIEEQNQLLGNVSDPNEKPPATLSTGGLEEIDVFADSPFESVQKATNVIREARELRTRVLLQRAATLSTVKRWDAVEKRAFDALELVERLGKPSVAAKCWFWYGLAQFHQGQIVGAAASFTKFKDCRSKKDPAWVKASNQAQEDYNGMDPDKWVKHCEEVIAAACAANSAGSEANEGYDDGSIDPRFEGNSDPDPDTRWYSVPRCSVGIGNWVMEVVNIDPNTLENEPRDVDQELGKWENARGEWGQLNESTETTRSLTLEDELAECAIAEDSNGRVDTEKRKNI